MIIGMEELEKRRQARAGRRALEREGRLGYALENLARATRLGPEERLRLARNIGRMAELRAPEKPRSLLKAAFDLWAERDPGQSDAGVSRWSKRLRYTRLGGDAHRNEAVTGEGRHFVQLATALVDVSSRPGGADGEHRTQMFAMLLAGTTHDLDRHGSVSLDLDASFRVARLAASMSADLARAVPGLPEYFRKVEDLALTHPLTRPHHEVQFFGQLSSFNDEVFELNGWDGSGPSGHLVGRAVYDGFMLGMHEGTGFAATCPRVEIATLSFSTSLHGVTAPSDWSGDEAAAAEHLRAAVADGSAGQRTVRQDWKVFLVALPGEETDSPSFRVALVIERILRTEGFPQLLGPFVPSLWPPDAMDIIDIDAWEEDPVVSAITDMEGRLCLLGGPLAARILALRASPTELLDVAAIAQGLPPCTIMPSVEVPAAWSEMPVTTLAGMIDRNLRHARQGAGLMDALVRDARARMGRLDAHEKQWRARPGKGDDPSGEEGGA